MDNITHSLVGAVLGQTGLKRRTRKGMAALVLGANAPDIDVFFGWVPWLPLATHRGFTHGVIGALIVMPLLLAGMLWALDRWQMQRRELAVDAPPMDFAWLLALSFLGNLTHPLLDLQTTYAVQLLSPFSTRWFHTDTLFIIDIWLLLLLGGSFWWSKRLEKRGMDWRRPATRAVMIMLAYIFVNGGITFAARLGLLRIAPQGFDHLTASPPPVAFWIRDLVGVKNGIYREARFNPLARPLVLTSEWRQASNLGDPLVTEAIAASPRVAQFMRWSIMPFATIRREACRATVTFNDARYSRQLSRGSFEHVVVLATHESGCL